MLYEFCDEKDLCYKHLVCKTRKVTYRAGGNETEIRLVLVDKDH